MFKLNTAYFGGGTSAGVSIPRSGFWVFKLRSCASDAKGQYGFNPSVGILGVQAQTYRSMSIRFSTVSIPRSGFWVFKRRICRIDRFSFSCFNPSVGILGVQAAKSAGSGLHTAKFQSLGRDSGCSSLILSNGQPTYTMFQSLGRDSGCSSVARRAAGCSVREFQSLGRDSGCSSLALTSMGLGSSLVSIPRSGFWVFKLPGSSWYPASYTSFNPSVGILGVQAWTCQDCRWQAEEFQSLGRDSGCSSPQIRQGMGDPTRVSIPRSGFWVFKPGRGPNGLHGHPSFNPSVGILGVQARAAPDRPGRTTGFNPSVGILGVQASNENHQRTDRTGFNPSVGILGVQARPTPSNAATSSPFQSLGRDSGCSSSTGWVGSAASWAFQSLGRDSGCSSRTQRKRNNNEPTVSIPRSGFWVFKLCGRIVCQTETRGFNPSVGILGVQAPDNALRIGGH